MAKKQPFFDIFLIFAKTVHTLRTKISTEGKRPKPTPLPHMRLWLHILQQAGFSESPKGRPFTILKTLRFLSLRYSADFRRSRLVLTDLVRVLDSHAGKIETCKLVCDWLFLVGV